jgi:RimJ/RimL family protein N-acetyltransferase
MELDQLTARLEVVSQRYAAHFGFDRNDAWYLLKLQEELGELTQAALKMQGQARTSGQSAEQLRTKFEDEFADVLGQLLLLGHHHQLDVSAAMQRKWLHWADRHDRAGTLHIQTPRLVLRSFMLADVDAFFAYRNDPQVARFQGWALPYSRTNAAQLIAEMFELNEPLRGQWSQIAIERQSAPGLIGDVAVNLSADGDTAEIGFTVAREYQAQGFGTEAIKALLAYLFSNLHTRRIIAFCDAENVAAHKLLSRAQFRQEATLRQSYFRDGRHTDEVQFALLKHEWQPAAA